MKIAIRLLKDLIPLWFIYHLTLHPKFMQRKPAFPPLHRFYVNLNLRLFLWNELLTYIFQSPFARSANCFRQSKAMWMKQQRIQRRKAHPKKIITKCKLNARAALDLFFLFFPFLQRKGWSDANNGKIHHHIRYCGGSLPPNLLRRI